LNDHYEAFEAPIPVKRAAKGLTEKSVTMKLLDPEKNLSKFFDSLKESRSRALLLDYDGTLAPFRSERDKALPYPGVVEALKGIIQKGGTHLVLISGRSLADLVSLVGLERLPEIWGSHGGERLLSDGTYRKATLTEVAARGLKSVSSWMAGMGWNGSVERKPLGLALHWRGMNREKADAMRAEVLDHLPQMIEGTGLGLHEFDGGLELRPSAVTKEEAVKTILAEMGGKVVAAYLGDDLTDEDAFQAIKGRGLSVLVRHELRETKADVWLRPPEELLDFLTRWETATS
jgi:trehalose-phosphatase